MARTKQKANGEGSVFQLKDGSWVAHTTYQGKAVCRYGKTKREVVAKLKDWLKLREAGISPKSDVWTLHAWLDHWLEESIRPRYDAEGVRYQGREQTTYENYERFVRRHIKPYFPDQPLVSLRPNTSSAGSGAWHTPA
jgi:Phage integrase, N-terminal SAM-like domain